MRAFDGSRFEDDLRLLGADACGFRAAPEDRCRSTRSHRDRCEERDLSERLVSWGNATIRSMSVDPIRSDPERPAKGGFPRWLYFLATFGTLLIGLGVAGLVLFLDTSLVDALGAGVNAALLLVAVLALVFAKSQVDAASEANRLSHAAQLAAAHAQQQASEQAERDSRASTRPYVYAELVTGLGGVGTWDLLIRNQGRTPARGLIVDATPWNDDDISTDLRRFCSQARDLPPAASLRLLWRMTADFADGTKEAGQDEVVTVRLRYADDQGGQWNEAYVVDCTYGAATLAPFVGATTTSGSGTDRALKDINHALRAIGTHLGEMRR